MIAEYMISSWPVASKSILMILKISSTYEVNLDSRIMDKILYIVGKNYMTL